MALLTTSGALLTTPPVFRSAKDSDAASERRRATDSFARARKGGSIAIGERAKFFRNFGRELPTCARRSYSAHRKFIGGTKTARTRNQLFANYATARTYARTYGAIKEREFLQRTATVFLRFTAVIYARIMFLNDERTHLYFKFRSESGGTWVLRSAVAAAALRTETSNPYINSGFIKFIATL